MFPIMTTNSLLSSPNTNSSRHLCSSILLFIIILNSFCSNCNSKNSAGIWHSKSTPHSCYNDDISSITSTGSCTNQKQPNPHEKLHKRLCFWRGGSDSSGSSTLRVVRRSGGTKMKNNPTKRTTVNIFSNHSDPYYILAQAIQSRLFNDNDDDDDDDIVPDLSRIVDSFQLLASAQQAFKGLDGAAHEAYQITSKTKKTIVSKSTTTSSSQSYDIDLISVSGRAQRSALRASAVANGLLACELCEFIKQPSARVAVVVDSLLDSVNGTMAQNHRQVVLNETNAFFLPGGTVRISILVLYEPNYHGGSGSYHGGIDDLTENGANNNDTSVPVSNGRLLVILGDSATDNLDQTIQVLDTKIRHITFPSSTIGGIPKRKRKDGKQNIVSVQHNLYQAAGSVLKLIEPQLRRQVSINKSNDNNSNSNTIAIHFIGQSLAGGIASLAASILNGDVPFPPEIHTNDSTESSTNTNEMATRRKKSKNLMKNSAVVSNESIDNDEDEMKQPQRPLHGFGRHCTSAFTLGAPPCMSSNVPAEYITSIVYGDDIVPRVSYDSLERFVSRARRAIDSSKGSGGIGSILGKNIHWMSDAITLAASNVQTQAWVSIGKQGSDDQEKLSIPGKAYLIRPRRLSNVCSIHEIGIYTRESFRAAILWQLNDILLSTSLWKHHQLDSYIHGLDRIQLRGIEENV